MNKLVAVVIFTVMFFGGGFTAAASDQESTCGGGLTVTECETEMMSSLTYNGQPIMPVAPIMEDDPRWDCHTMGNRICGPVPVRELPHTL